MLGKRARGAYRGTKSLISQRETILPKQELKKAAVMKLSKDLLASPGVQGVWGVCWGRKGVKGSDVLWQF